MYLCLLFLPLGLFILIIITFLVCLREPMAYVDPRQSGKVIVAAPWWLGSCVIGMMMEWGCETSWYFSRSSFAFFSFSVSRLALFPVDTGLYGSGWMW